jgi:hypothetical protein
VRFEKGALDKGTLDRVVIPKGRREGACHRPDADTRPKSFLVIFQVP